jgi:hypothetical protein
MRRQHSLALALFVGLTGLGCATAPTGTAHGRVQLVADSNCRNVPSQSGRIESLCGSPAEWAEFDRRIAELRQGFSCRPVRGSLPLCLFARQWEYLNRLNARRAGTQSSSFGDEARMSAMAISTNDYSAIRQSVIDSVSGMTLPIP